MWDVVEQLKEENTQMIEQDIPQLQRQIEALEMELKEARLQNRAVQCYYALDPDRTVKLTS